MNRFDWYHGAMEIETIIGYSELVIFCTLLYIYIDDIGGYVEIMEVWVEQ